MIVGYFIHVLILSFILCANLAEKGLRAKAHEIISSKTLENKSIE